jgi:hypothetical protein
VRPLATVARGLYVPESVAAEELATLRGRGLRRPHEFEPYACLPRLVTFALIIAAVALKNRK